MRRDEKGQALILVLILLLLGGLIIGPLLGFMGTGLIAGQTYEWRMDEVYADDAGIEDAIFNIITPGAPHYEDLLNLDEGESLPPYTLTDPVNGETVNVTVTKLALIQGILGEDEYKLGQPHEDWIEFTVPPGGITRDWGEGWVEYTCVINFTYDKPSGASPRMIQTAGAFFLPDPGYDGLGNSLIDDDSPYQYIGDTGLDPPYAVSPWGVFTFENLQTDSPETKVAAGGFAFIWRWEQNQGPNFNPGDDGGFSFKFKINDPAWEEYIYFSWATVKQQDISYVTSGDFWKWLIEATAGDTTVQSAVLAGTKGTDIIVSILTWEINPPEE